MFKRTFIDKVAQLEKQKLDDLIDSHALFHHYRILVTRSGETVNRNLSKH